jgi:hypothetical protein
MMAFGFLTAAAQMLTDDLRTGLEHVSGLLVASVSDDGYSALTAPYVAVDAPRLAELAGRYLSGANGTVRAEIPVRVVPANTAATGLLTLTDSVLDVLVSADYDIDSVEPAIVTAPAAAGTPLPAYRITVSCSLTGRQ